MRTLNTEVRRVLLALAEKFERQAKSAHETSIAHMRQGWGEASSRAEATSETYYAAAAEVRDALEQLEEWL